MRSILLGAALATAMITPMACGKRSDGITLFHAQLSGANEVPPAGSGASGACGFELDGNRVLYSIDVHGLTQVIGAHIHIAPPGVNGPVRVVLFPFPGGPVITSPTGAINGRLMAGNFVNAHVTGGLTFNDIVTAMSSGNAYCNVHTSRFPGGEIRGPIQVVTSD